MQRCRIAWAVDGNALQQHALEEIGLEHLPRQDPVVHQRQGDIGEDVHLQRVCGGTSPMPPYFAHTTPLATRLSTRAGTRRMRRLIVDARGRSRKLR